MEEKRIVWKPVVGYEGLYEVNNIGEVRGIDRYLLNRCHNGMKLWKGKDIKHFSSPNGYLRVVLGKDGKSKHHLVHRLVAEAFLPNPDNLPQVNHKDEEDKTNNFVWVNSDGTVDPDKSSIEWCTSQYNMTYGTRIERASTKCFKAIMQFTKSGEFIQEFPSIVDASKHLNIQKSDISSCCHGRLNTAGGFIWQFKNIA